MRACGAMRTTPTTSFIWHSVQRPRPGRLSLGPGNGGAGGMGEGQASRPMGEGVRGRGPPRLFNLCLGALVEAGLEEVLAACGDVLLPLLPFDAKAALLAAARLQGLRPPPPLLAEFSDPGWTFLDLAGLLDDGDADAKAAAVLAGSRSVVHLDLSGAVLRPETLLLLASWCPRLRTLAVGGSPEATTSAAAAIEKIVPRVVVAAGSAAASWEDAEVDLDAAARQGGVLTQLEELWWPDAPKAVVKRLARKCPKVDVVQGRRERAPDPALEACDLDRICPSIMRLLEGNNEAEGEEEAEDPVRRLKESVPIAQRFLWAFASRARRIKEKRAKERQREERKAQSRRAPAGTAAGAVADYLDSL